MLLVRLFLLLSLSILRALAQDYLELVELEKPETCVDVDQIAADLINVRDHVWTGSKNYDFTLQRHCFCISEYLEPMQVKVRDGLVKTAISYPGDPMTIPQFYDLIQRRCVSGCAMNACHIVYGPDGEIETLGIGSVDPLISDTGITYQITNFKIVATEQ